jgi:selenocysteine lyase/cysteine desulfurase
VFETGTPPYLNIRFLGEALQYLYRIGIPDIAAYVAELVSYFAEQAASYNIPLLTDYPPEHRSAIQRLAVTPEQNARLAPNNILARYKNNQLTVALNFYNNRADIDRLFTTLDYD